MLLIYFIRIILFYLVQFLGRLTLILVGENGYGDDFGIGNPESFTIKNVAEMFQGKIEMLPERKGNRMTADIITDKIEALGWKATKKLDEYINISRDNQWK
jgi:UDP-glucose 4-epimerase